MRYFASRLRECFVVVSPRGARIQRQIKLILLAKFKAGFGHGIIPNLRRRMPFR